MSGRRLTRLVGITGGILLAGCYGPEDGITDSPPGAPVEVGDPGGDTGEPATPTVGPTSPHGPSTENPSAPGNPPTETPASEGALGLPCDVRRVFEAHCLACHGSPPSAPVSLVSHANLTAPAKSDPNVRLGEMVVRRMADTARPMPPGQAPSVPADQQQVVAAWVQAGMPQGPTCEAPKPGGPQTEEPPAKPSPFDAPPQCSSNKYWTDGDDGSSRMNPGRACIGCHSTSDDDDAPRFWVAGTVYPTAHEPNLCRGVDGSGGKVQVRITDATGQQWLLPVNASGNFMLRRSAAPSFQRPFQAAVLFEGRERKMGTPQTTGDCNSCHTQAGANGAPGRIVLP